MLRRKDNKVDQISGQTKRLQIDVNKKMQKFVSTNLNYIHWAVYVFLIKQHIFHWNFAHFYIISQKQLVDSLCRMSHENSTFECGLIKSEHVRLILVKDKCNNFVQLSKNKPSQENKVGMQHDPSESCNQKASLTMNEEKN